MSLHLSLPPSGERVSAHPEPDPPQVAAWVDGLRDEEPLRAAQQLIDFLVPMNRTRMRVALRQEVAELIVPVALPLLEELSRTLDAATVPLGTRVRSAADLADELLIELAYAYKTLLMEQSRRLFGLASSGRAQVPVVRAMQLLAERLALSYRMYATPPRGVWLEIHALYHFALRRGFAQRGIEATGVTPLDIYRQALLLAFAEPLKLMRGELDIVREWIERHGDLAELLPANGSRNGQHGAFLVKTQRDQPGHSLSKRQQGNAQANDSILCTAGLAELLREQSSRLAKDKTPERIGRPESWDVDTVDLLRRMARQWDSTPARRYERLRTHARVDVHLGIDGIWQSLNAVDSQRVHASEWIITNEGAGGFALVHDQGDIDPIRVGDVIGIRMERDDNVHVCVVRWVLSDHPGHIELGVEEMAPTAHAVSIRQLCDEIGRNPEPVLLLPEVHALNQAPAILAPLVPLDTTCELNLGELQSRVRVKATQLLERTVSVQLLQFSPVN